MPATTRPLGQPQRIAVLRALRGLGDMLCAVPALRALKAALPEARVTLVGLPVAGPFAERFSAYIDDFAAMPGFPGIHDHPASVAELPDFLRRMHAEEFDLALQMHGSGIVSNPLASLLGARRLAGFYLPGQWLPDEELFAPYPADLAEPRRWLALTSHLGIAPVGEHLEFPISAEDRDELASLPEASALDAAPYALVHPGAHDPRRRWPAERFATVADSLAERGLRVVLTGTAEERPIVEAVASAMRAKPLDLAGRTGLGALATAIEGSRIVVSNDTGTSHLASALRVPSVVLYTGASDERRWGPLDRQLHRRCGPPPREGEGGCGLPVNERCLRDGCVVSDGAFEPYYAPVADVLGQVEELLAKEREHVA